MVGENYSEVADCEVKIVENFVQDLHEPKSGDCKSDAHVNCMKLRKENLKLIFFHQLMSCKFGKKTKGLKYSKYLFAWHGRFQISTINLRTSFFQVKRSGIG